MKTKHVNWALTRKHLGHLSAVMQPIRSYREVGSLMGLSTTLVCQLENSALRKVAKRMAELESNERVKHE